MQINKLTKNFEKYAFLTLLLIYVFFSFYRLGQIIFNVDAQHWYLRSTNFIEAIKDFDWRQTYQDPKPGVTLMWLSGTSLDLTETLYKIKNGPAYTPNIYVFDDFYLLNFAAKFPLVVFAVVFFVFYYFSLKRLFLNKPLLALISSMFLAFEPFYLGITRFLHVDALLTFFMSSALLIFFLWLKEKRTLLLILSGIITGLACLTKSQGLFLTPFVYMVMLTEKANIKHFIIYLFSAVLIHFLIFPAMWVAPLATYKSIINEALFVVETGNTQIRPFTYYFQNLFSIMSPLTMASLITGMYFTFAKKTKFIIYAFCYLVLYLIAISFIKQKIDRYMLPMFPFTTLIAGYGVWNALQYFTQTKKVAIITLIFLIGLVYTASYFPHFVTAAGGGESKNEYGSLYNEVGKYLNTKPNAPELKVVTMTKPHALRPFFRGKTFGHEEPMPAGWTAEYFVTNSYWNAVYGVPEIYKNCALEKSIYFREQKYWDIYRCK